MSSCLHTSRSNVVWFVRSNRVFHLAKIINVKIPWKSSSSLDVSSPSLKSESVKSKSIGRKSKSVSTGLKPKSLKTGFETDSNPSPGHEYYISAKNSKGWHIGCCNNTATPSRRIPDLSISRADAIRRHLPLQDLSIRWSWDEPSCRAFRILFSQNWCKYDLSNNIFSR